MHIYNRLTAQIDGFQKIVFRHNPFYRQIFAGELTPRQLAEYIFNMRYSLLSAVDQIKGGVPIAQKKGLSKLSAFYAHKASEEDGHYLWAEEDLAALRQHFHLEDKKYEVSKEMAALVDYNNELMANHPSLYMIYLLFAEYFTVQASPPCLAALEERCQIPQKFLSLIGKHVELDQGHVEEWRETIHELDLDLRYLEENASRVLGEVMDNYVLFWNHVGESPQ